MDKRQIIISGEKGKSKIGWRKKSNRAMAPNEKK